MSLKILLLLLVTFYTLSTTHSQLLNTTDFLFNGFQSTNLTLNGLAEIHSDGILFLTNRTSSQTGHAFYSSPIAFKNSTNDSAISFSTSFVFGIIPEIQLGGHGISFVIAPQPALPGALPNDQLGLIFNASINNSNGTNHVIAVEFDTVFSPELDDVNNNHVGIDIDSLKSVEAKPAGYYIDNNKTAFQNLSLISDESRRVWIEYDGVKKQMNVTIAPINMKKPSIPLLSLDRDLSQYMNPFMYVGFAAATGAIFSSQYLLGWSFKINGQAQELQISKLPRIFGPKKPSMFLTIGLPLIIGFVVLTVIAALVYYVRRRKKFAEEFEDWELEYGPHRFKYKDLYLATNGFSDNEVLGTGGFGKVYKGFLSSSKTEVAVKRVSHESKQGMREFVAEIVSMGKLRHRNLVQLIGYCRRKNELLLVYEYMSGGSLDKLLFNSPVEFTLSWSQRLFIIKGVASGLFYLHEGWEQVVIHRDVKAANVLLDNELNGKLGDFGLARLYDHGTVSHSTNVVGTLGYLAPEQMWTGKVSDATDVYAFGAFLLEVACGRRPIGIKDGEFVLVKWVFSLWGNGLIVNAVDPRLEGVFDVEEVELVLKLGLLCSNVEPSDRPSMREVVEYLSRHIPLPELSSIGISTGLSIPRMEGFNDFGMLFTSSMEEEASTSTGTPSMAVSLLTGSR